jgi:hypothetical protein
LTNPRLGWCIVVSTEITMPASSGRSASTGSYIRFAVEAAFAAGDLVVTEGVMALRPGAPAVAAEPAGSVAGEPSASGG